MAARVLPVRSKLAPLPARKRREGAGGMGRGAAQSEARSGDAQGLDKIIGTSPVQEWVGTTYGGMVLRRKRFQNQAVCDLWHSLNKLQRADEAAAIIGCGRWFFKSVLPCGGYRLTPIYCDSMLCAACSGRRSKPLQIKVLGLVQAGRKAGRRHYHAVFTLRNEKSLDRAFIGRLVESFSRLRNDLLWKNILLPDGATGEIFGGVYSVEATYNGDRRDWHPHLHVVFEAPANLPSWWKFAIESVWAEITGGSFIVRIRPLYGLDKKGRMTRKPNMRAVKELVKYVTKTAEFSREPARVSEFLTAFRNVRRIQTFGCWLGKKETGESEAPKDSTVGDSRTPRECVCRQCCESMFFKTSEKFHISCTCKREGIGRQLSLFDNGPPRKTMEEETWEETAARWHLESESQDEIARRQVRLTFSDYKFRRQIANGVLFEAA